MQREACLKPNTAQKNNFPESKSVLHAVPPCAILGPHRGRICTGEGRRHTACSAGQVHHPIRQPCSYSAPAKQSCTLRRRRDRLQNMALYTCTHLTTHRERLAYGSTPCSYLPRLQTNGLADLDLATELLFALMHACW